MTEAVVIRKTGLRGYPGVPPFDEEGSGCLHAELTELISALGKKVNRVQEIIPAGSRVLIKPNIVTHRHFLGKEACYGSVVHGSMLRPLIDFAWQSGATRILVADNPVEGDDFEKTMDFTGIRAMIEKLKQRGNIDLDVCDLRPRVLLEDGQGRFYSQSQPGDPLGYVEVDLGCDSLFAELDEVPGIHYYTLADSTVDHMDPRKVQESVTDEYHFPGVHRYLVAKSVLDADIVINVAKMKTHCKAGVSLCLKNMIGMVYLKECMPHHRPGKPPIGDSFPDFPSSHYVASRKAYRFMRQRFSVHRLPGFKLLRDFMQRKGILVGAHIEHGNWKGNDTIWRTILDLNRIALYADKNGVMRGTPQRRMLCVIDGIVGQQGEGPMAGKPVNAGMLMAGMNPVVVDALAARAMGIDWRSIPQIAQARNIRRWPLLPPEVVDLDMPEMQIDDLHFQMPKGWK